MSDKQPVSKKYTISSEFKFPGAGLRRALIKLECDGDSHGESLETDDKLELDAAIAWLAKALPHHCYEYRPWNADGQPVSYRVWRTR